MLKYLPNEYWERLTGTPVKPLDNQAKRIIDQRLSAFNLETLEDNSDPVALPLPAEFGTISEELSKAYTAYEPQWDAMMSLVNSKHPVTPSSFNCPRGWSYWNGSEWVPASEPSGKTFVADAETVKMDNGQWHPTCMVLMSSNGWMVWRTPDVNTVTVVPMGNNNTVVGYNVSYDRSFMSSEYLLAESGNSFVDLMSMWIVTNGMSNQQRIVDKMHKGGAATDDNSFDMGKPVWLDKTTTNGLAPVYQYYTGKELDKGVRDSIIANGSEWSIDNISEVIRYCLQDVVSTHELSRHLVPAYMNARPSNVNRFGSMALGSCWVPMSAERFPGFYGRVEQKYQDIKLRLNTALMAACDKYLQDVTNGTLVADTTALDWTLAKTGKNKGMPKWYRDLLPKAKAGGLSLTMRFAPIVLQMTYNKLPLYWDNGWTTSEGNVTHPTNRGARVTNMFLKDLASLFDNGYISVPDSFKPLVAERVSVINWVSSRERVLGIHTESPEGIPVTIPMMAVNGTITGRATDSVWQVLANPKATRIGTELKSMVAPFPGYSLVGADADSEEAWLAGLHGDQDLGFNASSPFGAINAMGNSKQKTDIHSLSATKTGYSRDICKTRVYGCLYGQGVKGDSDVIMKADPTLEAGKAKQDSVLFLEYLKGKKDWDNGGYENGLASLSFTQMERIADRKLPRTPLTGAYMSRALAGIEDYKPTRVNWVVQSSGCDFRDMFVLLALHFFKKLDVNGRLVLTIHDEFRFMVKDEDITKATYALQLAHLYTRTGFLVAHKLDNIPAGCAWFSSVDIDNVCLRKDPTANQMTPTQPPLPPGYGLNARDLLDLL